MHVTDRTTGAPGTPRGSQQSLATDGGSAQQLNADHGVFAVPDTPTTAARGYYPSTWTTNLPPETTTTSFAANTSAAPTRSIKNEYYYR